MVAIWGLSACPAAELAAASASVLYVWNEGACGLRIVTPFNSTPVLAQAFSIHTKGARPLKMPTPPRSNDL